MIKGNKNRERVREQFRKLKKRMQLITQCRAGRDKRSIMSSGKGSVWGSIRHEGVRQFKNFLMSICMC